VHCWHAAAPAPPDDGPGRHFTFFCLHARHAANARTFDKSPAPAVTAAAPADCGAAIVRGGAAMLRDDESGLGRGRFFVGAREAPAAAAAAAADRPCGC